MITEKDALAADLGKLTPDRVRSASAAELKALAPRVRQFLADSLAGTSGDLAANLSTVELTLALHRVFASPGDRIVWDTGHQALTHKILTGRAARFHTVNDPDGMSPLVSRTESEHDVITGGHRGTAVSVALGLALGKALKGETQAVVAVVGDGALAEGSTLEALNHAAVTPHANLIIVLNDNGDAGERSVGALGAYLRSLEIGKRAPEVLFTALGFDYVGPVDGHDVEAVVRALEQARISTIVPLVHVKTRRGQGMPRSIPSPPLPSPGHAATVAARLESEMARDDRIVVIAPALAEPALGALFKRFPDRVFDPGPEEQHALTLTIGFALEGLKPVLLCAPGAVPRAFDALLNAVCVENQPTLIVALGGGAKRGWDVTACRDLPNLQVLCPTDRAELERMLGAWLKDPRGPTIIAVPDRPSAADNKGAASEDRRGPMK